jgi:uncharacterized protein YjbI with pentapeptide repeats
VTAASGAPRLQVALEALADPVIDVETSWEDLDVTGSVDLIDANGWDVRGCRLTGLDLTGQLLDGVQLRDSIVQSCEMAGVVAEAAGANRVEFVGCRLTGAVFTTARMRRVRFVRCRLDQAVFRMAETEYLGFEECDLRGADFTSALLPDSVFDDCNLEGANFSQAKLSGARFHGSNVAGLLGGTSLAGIQIDPSQISDMALNVFDAIGITITDPRGD